LVRLDNVRPYRRNGGEALEAASRLPALAEAMIAFGEVEGALLST